MSVKKSKRSRDYSHVRHVGVKTIDEVFKVSSTVCSQKCLENINLSKFNIEKKEILLLVHVH